MLNKAMLLPAGGPHLVKIAVRALIHVNYYGSGPNSGPPEKDKWEWLNGRTSSLEAAEFLRVEECPGAHLVLKKILKSGGVRLLSFVFFIEPDVAGDVGAVSRLRELLASKRLRPALFDKNLEVKPSQDAHISCQGENEVTFYFPDSRGRQDGLYQGVEERPAGSRDYYLQLECYVGLTR